MRAGFVAAIAFMMLLFHGVEGLGQSTPPMPSGEKLAKSQLTFKTIAAPGKGFGYDIYSDGKMLIHQPSVPGLPGNDGFKTKSDSEKVAALVIKKLKGGQMPPTVTHEELKRLKVLE